VNIRELVDSLGLEPLPGEGGLWREIYREPGSNAIYFAMISPDFSAWHRIKEPELWIHIAGAPTELFIIESGELREIHLDRDSGNFAYRVPPNTWMAAKPTKDWSLQICSLAPAFSGMELATRAGLSREFPRLTLPGLFHE
jgi:predicted cupin superfamily sugar epimerase